MMRLVWGYDEDPTDALFDALGADRTSAAALAANLPFGPGDSTVGCENELQTAVIGKQDEVDLPLTIRHSNYFENIIRRAKAGDSTSRAVTSLERFLDGNQLGVWENSWVRLPRWRLNRFAVEVLEQDLRSNPSQAEAPWRLDLRRFLCRHQGEECLRVPVSYLLKLALVQLLDAKPPLPAAFTRFIRSLCRSFTNDNTSPEVLSFYISPLRDGKQAGSPVARENALRFLLVQLLVAFANDVFLLRATGQLCRVYSAPQPPARQRQISEKISDSFYRELFMSPCLSGWERGEEKEQYMHLCHRVLTQSQMNALAKLREAGIISRNLIVLPAVCNISLANNGTHVSLGSRRIGDLLKDSSSGVGPVHEKYLGDLVIKIVEHFLPLFVGVYSGAPHRLGFEDFHPERVLGFLPHELDYTHLRTLWRRWKQKAKLRVLGVSLTPFGPRRMDRFIGTLFRLCGDFIPDYRLIDYFVALMSTPQSPALNGELGSEDSLKADLTELGVFDERMALYLPYRLRSEQKTGFSGFEGRFHSAFETFEGDLGRAVELQNLITALALQYAAQGTIRHCDIPDDPLVESERRQVLFTAAIGIDSFNVRADTPNRFLIKVLQATAGVRPDRRYANSLRVGTRDYLLGLHSILRKDAAELIDSLQVEETLADLEQRLKDPQHTTVGRMVKSILKEAGARAPLSLSADEFNQAAERYFREKLRMLQTKESIEIFAEECRRLNREWDDLGPELKDTVRLILNGQTTSQCLEPLQRSGAPERLKGEDLPGVIRLLVLVIQKNSGEVGLGNQKPALSGTSSVY